MSFEVEIPWIVSLELCLRDERIAELEELLRRLRTRLDRATCAGVEQWPEYAELKEVS